MFKVDNKYVNFNNGVVLVSLLLTFTPCSCLSCANFEHIIAGWIIDKKNGFIPAIQKNERRFDFCFYEILKITKILSIGEPEGLLSSLAFFFFFLKTASS